MNLKGQMAIVFILSWRNVWSNKRRTVLTLLTIVVGTALIILSNAFAKGSHDDMIETAVASNVGHIQVHEKGYWKNRSIDYGFVFSEEIRQELVSLDDVEAFALRVNAMALLSYQDNTAGVMIQGVDPEQEIKVSTINNYILKGGRYLRAEDRQQVVLGESLAKNVGMGVGDSFVIISQGFDGSIAAENLEVVGLFKSGNPEYDRSLVLMPLEQAKQSFSMMGRITTLVVRIKEFKALADVKSRLMAMVSQEDIEVMGWDELMPELVQYIVMDNIGAYIFDMVLFIVVAFGILNTIQMAVFERTREFGIMLAVGTTPFQIVATILVETAIIAAMGVVLGVALGASMSYYWQVNPIYIGQYAQQMSVYGVNILSMSADATWLSVTLTAIITFSLAVLFSIFPARRAARLKPVEAIRQL